MKDLKRRLVRFAWKNVTPDMLEELADSMSMRIENVIKNKAVHSGYS